MKKEEVLSFTGLEEMSVQAADHILSLIGQSPITDTFSMALSGGKSVRELYRLLASDVYSRQIPWNGMHLFQVDERYVPFNDPDNNFRMIEQLLVSRVPIPSGNVHRIDTRHFPIDSTVLQYENDLRRHFREKSFGGFPRFDCIVLGIGPDGHTASLFPGSPQVYEKIRSVCAVAPPAMEPRVSRISMTLPVINNAGNALFVCAGQEKKEIIDAIIDPSNTAAQEYPAAMVRPAGTLRCFFSALS